MRRRSLLKQMAAIPAAATVAACARGSGAAPEPAKAPRVGGAVAIDDVTRRQKQWPFKSLTSYTTKDADDLVKMPAKPTLLDFIKHRFLLAEHLLLAADWAMGKGLPEPVILGCLLHDIGQSLARPDHGFWGAQLVRPYVTEEVSWAIEAHQSLRFYADPENGYKGPPSFYRAYFGADYKPDPYIEKAYEAARAHKWYMSARLITMSDQETPEPKDIYVTESKHAEVLPEKFADLIGRNFKQPEEGLGYDSSPVNHMWRTIINPTRML
ncbi:MAG: hypothetical protein JWO36_7509 [Myxococcales bacterium]|nr:hypothetical protein [Myxococcales bacterium]